MDVSEVRHFLRVGSKLDKRSHVDLGNSKTLSVSNTIGLKSSKTGLYANAVQYVVAL